MSEDLPHCMANVVVGQSGRSAPESNSLHPLMKALDEIVVESASDQAGSQAAGKLRGDPLMHCQPM
jgi:hypothetical protein